MGFEERQPAAAHCGQSRALLLRCFGHVQSYTPSAAHTQNTTLPRTASADGNGAFCVLPQIISDVCFAKWRMLSKKLLVLVPVLLVLLSGCVKPEEMLRNPVLSDVEHINSDVVIGVALPLSGRYAVEGNEMLPGAKAAVDQLNNRRGVAGRRVRLEVCDTKSNPADAAAAVSTLAAKGASVIIGGFSTNETHGLVKAAPKAQVPLIIPCASSDDFSRSSGFVFRTGCTDTQMADGIASYLWYWRQIRQIGVLVDVRPSSEYERNISRSVAKSFSDLGGSVASSANYSDVASCVAAMKRVMAGGPQAIVVSAVGPEAAQMVKALRKLGYTGVICGADGWEGSEFLHTLGKDFQPGECFFVSFFSKEYKDDEYSAFSEYFRKKYYHLPGARAAAVRDAVFLACGSLVNVKNIKQFRRSWLAMQNFFGASSVYNPQKSGDVDRMLFINSIIPSGIDGEYPSVRLIRGFMHSKLETYKMD